jgi:hypothetical protein
MIFTDPSLLISPFLLFDDVGEGEPPTIADRVRLSKFVSQPFVEATVTVLHGDDQPVEIVVSCPAATAIDLVVFPLHESVIVVDAVPPLNA